MLSSHQKMEDPLDGVHSWNWKICSFVGETENRIIELLDLAVPTMKVFLLLV
jgi:hypothetical protein